MPETGCYCVLLILMPRFRMCCRIQFVVGGNRWLCLRYRLNHSRARCWLEKLAQESGKALKEQMWNFAVLGIREARNGAASAARKADVVAVSASGQLEFPGAVRVWLDMWLWLLEDENPALLCALRFIGYANTWLGSPLFEPYCTARGD
jgi:hypothetical protein